MKRWRSVRRWMAVGLLAAMLATLGAAVASAQDQGAKVDTAALVKETQRVFNEGNRLTILWWVPEQFWQAALSQSPGLTPEAVEQFLQAFRPYTLVAVIDGKVSVAGVEYRPLDEIRGALRLIDGRGEVHQSLADDKVNPVVVSMLAMMKPVLSGMMGPMGQNMHFFVFDAKDAQGQSFCDPLKEGSFTIKLDEREFKLRLPLGSLLPPKTCPKCKQECSGAWKFCPYDGTPLPKPPAAPAAPAAKPAATTPAKHEAAPEK